MTRLLRWGLPALLIMFGCAATPTALSAQTCATPLAVPVANACVVTPGVLWRGGKPDATGATALLSQGVRTVVNLEWLHSDVRAFSHARPDTHAAEQIGYFRVPDWEPLAAIAPTVLDDHVAHFIAIMRSQPKPVYVHCRSGQNRTGVMVAAYRVFGGMSRDDAIAEMAGYDGYWADFDATYIRGLTPAKLQALEPRVAAWTTRLQASATIECGRGSCVVRRATQQRQ